MKTRRIGPFEVAEIGLGCMNLSHAYGTPPEPAAAEALLLQALDAGVTLFDTAALYGFGANETLVGRVLKAHRSRIVLCSKGGMTGQPVGAGGALQRVIDGRPASVQRDCEDSLRRLGTDVIDLYYLHRWDKTVPIEDSVGAMARLVEQGKVRALGLSEVSAATLNRAQAVHPIAALQTEYSLWTRNPEIAVLQACADSGTAFVAFSPVGRGFLCGAPLDAAGFAPKDIRRAMPRFEPAHATANAALLPGLADLAAQAGCTAAQLALAWLLAQGKHIVPIPGTTQPAHLQENLGAAAVTVPPALMAALDALFAPARISGARYNAQNQSEVDTEQFAA
ncbi:aldo/keto reductase [beta proteobacterium AAP121]|nr:aldo/keto reductase [beta proteobacterium AAP65]KPF93046.1 aldo/keto reductase [beta proteobacterium AAP121]